MAGDTYADEVMASADEEAGSAVANGGAPAPGRPVELPLQPKKSDLSIPPPGQALTGKQEHCAFGLSLARRRESAGAAFR